MIVKSSLESSIQSHNIELPSTNSLIKFIETNGYLTENKNLADIFCHFDENEIEDTLFEIRSDKDYTKKILEALKDE